MLSGFVSRTACISSSKAGGTGKQSQIVYISSNKFSIIIESVQLKEEDGLTSCTVFFMKMERLIYKVINTSTIKHLTS